MKVITLVTLICLSIGVNAQEIKWVSFEEAVELQKTAPKKLLVDIYTDWCGWCKKMDKDTYANNVIADYINKNYYAVRFNAEQKAPITFNDHTFKFINAGKRGVHELALALTNNQQSYPMTVFLDEEFRILQAIPGYQTAQAFEPIIQYLGDDHFKSTPWADFEKSYKSSL